MEGPVRQRENVGQNVGSNVGFVWSRATACCKVESGQTEKGDSWCRSIKQKKQRTIWNPWRR
jgi:hypothetical protein